MTQSMKPSASAVSLSNPFVGRHQEMAELNATLEDATAGRGRVVMLSGEPGIGKTRTARELAALAEQQGSKVLWGRCHEEQGAPPYWPWVQVIRSYIRDCDLDQLRSEMEAGAADIAEMVPEVGRRLRDLQPLPVLDSPERARFRLFDATTTFLKNAARNQPLVIILDNLHWADHPSLLLLEFSAQEVGDSPLLLVGSYRDTELVRGHQLSRSIGELAREPYFLPVQLKGLNVEEVRSLARGLPSSST